MVGRRLILIAALVALGGCAGRPEPQTKVIYQTVEKPVPVSCVPPGLRPVQQKLLTPAEAASMEGPSRYAAIASDWLLRVARMNDTEPVVQACGSTR